MMNRYLFRWTMIALLLGAPRLAPAAFTTDPATILYRLYHQQSLYEITRNNAENVAGDLIFTGKEFYGVYPKEVGLSRVDLLFCNFDDTGALKSVPVQLTDPVHHWFRSPRLVWNGQVFGMAYSTASEGKFCLVSTAGVATAPVTLPKDFYHKVDDTMPVSKCLVLGLKPVWTGIGYLVFGLIMEPADMDYIDPMFTHLVLWRLDPNGQLLDYRYLGTIYPFSGASKGSEHGWFNVAWNGQYAMLAAVDMDDIFAATVYFMIDAYGRIVINARPCWTSGLPVVAPMIACTGNTFALTGHYTDLQSSLSSYFIRFFDRVGTPLGPEAQYNAGEPTFLVHSAVSWMGDKYVAAFPTFSAQYQAVVRLAAFSEGGARLAPNTTMIALGDANIDFTWLMLGEQLKLVGDGARVMVQGLFYHILEQKHGPLVYSAVGDVGTPFPPLIISPFHAGAFPNNLPLYFNWLPVARAAAYQLQVARDEAFKDLVLDQAIANGATWFGLNPGALAGKPARAMATLYYWRVKADNTDYSAVRQFTLQTPGIQNAAGAAWRRYW